MKLRRCVTLVASGVSIAAAIILLVRTGLPERADYSRMYFDGVPNAPEIGALAPPFQASLLDGQQLALNSLRGTPVILNFWATWCVPCEYEMPVLQELHESYAPEELQIVAVNSGESRTTIEAWMTRLQLSIQVALDTDLTILSAYQVRGQPQTFVIDRQGFVRSIFYGAVDKQRLIEALLPLF